MAARYLPPRRGRLNSTQVDLERGGCLFLYPDSNSEHRSPNIDRLLGVQRSSILLYPDLSSEHSDGSAQIWGGEVTSHLSRSGEEEKGHGASAQKSKIAEDGHPDAAPLPW
jgi:hypothetical protein